MNLFKPIRAQRSQLRALWLWPMAGVSVPETVLDARKDIVQGGSGC